MDYRTRAVKVLYKIITMDVVSSRYLGQERDSKELAEMLKTLSGYNTGTVNELYAEIVTFTKSMSFDWSIYDDIPEEYKAVEEWWNMVESNKPDVDTFLYFIDNVPSPVAIELVNGVVKGQKVWVPKVQQDSKGEKDADPN